jgi:hypothetical protein
MGRHHYKFCVDTTYCECFLCCCYGVLCFGYCVAVVMFGLIHSCIHSTLLNILKNKLHLSFWSILLPQPFHFLSPFITYEKLKKEKRGGGDFEVVSEAIYGELSMYKIMLCFLWY